MTRGTLTYRGWAIHRDVLAPATHRWTASPDDYETVIHERSIEFIMAEIDDHEDEKEAA